MLGADTNELPSLDMLQRIQDGWDEWAQLLETIGARHDYNYRKSRSADVLLEFEILIGRQKPLKPPCQH